MCVEPFTLPQFVLSFPINTTVNSTHLSAAIFNRRSLFRTRLVTLCRAPRISIACRPVINAISITYIIKYHCTITLVILCISAVQAIHNGRQKLKTALLTRTVAPSPVKHKMPDTAKQMRCGARDLLHRLLRSIVGSCTEVHQRTFLIFKETNKVRCIWEIMRDQLLVNKF